jgi:hypothetical protein
MTAERHLVRAKANWIKLGIIADDDLAIVPGQWRQHHKRSKLFKFEFLKNVIFWPEIGEIAKKLS